MDDSNSRAFSPHVPDFSSPYLSRGLIAYIGNKRLLLPRIARAIARNLPASSTPPLLLDPFGGSGGVSRAGRAMGLRVGFNDIEYYSALIARSRIVLEPRRLEEAFSGEGGAVKTFAALDAFASGASPPAAAGFIEPGLSRTLWLEAFEAAERSPPYIARHYAPVSTSTADWRRERLFYTAENARFLDRAREAIERRYPFDPLDLREKASFDPRDTVAIKSGAGADAKAALTEVLLYQAATHTNTSGIFKACHRGFGGHGGDALGRILAPMRLLPPDLITGPGATSSSQDAAEFCRSRQADIVYLDPPYNQHQYGSNYHLLTTLSRWDRPPVSEKRAPDGFLLDRSGIRRDWQGTRSLWCGKRTAEGALRTLLEAVDARLLILSYSDGGILPLELVADLLSSHGDLSLEVSPYIAYRGGKQSSSRIEHTSELLFVLKRGGASLRSGEAARARLERERALSGIYSLLAGHFHPERLRSILALLPSGHPLATGGRIREDGIFSLGIFEPSTLTDAELKNLHGLLAKAACTGAREAFDVALEGGNFRSALLCLRKLAFRKYADDYIPARDRLGAALAGKSLAGLEALDRQAVLRGLR